MKRTDFDTLIHRNDQVGMHAIGRALVHLFNRQTLAEKEINTTMVHNLRGFTGADGRRGCITAKYYIKHQKLEDWQIKYWLEPNKLGTTRLGKYYRQILEEVKKKQAA